MSLATHDHKHDHPHDHAHDHAHTDADHVGHSDAHNHEPAARRADPGVSLLRMSSFQRLTLAGGLVAAIWLGAFWAWS